MIGPEDERPKEGPEAHQDAVTVELCDLDRRVCALLRVVRTAGSSDPSMLALACLDGETVAAGDEPGSVHLDTVEPLSRWNARFRHGAVALEVEVEATSAPIDLDEPLLAEAAGVHRYEQLCRVRGELRVDGDHTPIEGVGRRAHAWGDPAATRFRSLYAVARERALTVTAVRPPSGGGHGEEVIAAYLVQPQSEPERFESARLSTIYDSAGRPRTAGLELLMQGDEYPRRATGEAICQTSAEPLQAACFRWSLDGEPAQGGYQLVTPE
jgi:hypothetical protein